MFLLLIDSPDSAIIPHKKKRENLYLLPVPPIEALALPNSVETSNAKASRRYAYTTYIIPIITTNITKEHVNIPTETFTAALLLTEFRTCEIPTSQNQSVK